MVIFKSLQSSVSFVKACFVNVDLISFGKMPELRNNAINRSYIINVVR